MPNDEDVASDHGQQGCAVDAEDGDEELDGQLWDAQHHGGLVRRVEDGRHGAGDEERDEPRGEHDAADHLDREDGVLAERKTGGQDPVDLQHREHDDVLKPARRKVNV